MRVVLAIPTLERGGAELQLARLAVELQQRGEDVEVLAVVAGGPLEGELRAQGVPVSVVRALDHSRLGVVSSASLPPSVRRLLSLPTKPLRVAVDSFRRVMVWREIWRRRPDVLHAYLPTAAEVLMPGAAIGGVPARVTGRRSMAGRDLIERFDRWRTWRVNRSIHLAIANSEAVKESILAAERPAPPRVEVIPNGVELPATPAEVSGEPVTVVCVANLNAWKGHDDLLHAWVDVDASARLRLVGEGPRRAHLEKLADDLGISGRVEFVGSVADVSGELASAQVAVLASHVEGLPNAVMEAMAAGLPVVATDVGGVRTLVEHGTSGLVVEAHAPSQLASALQALISDSALRVRLGASGRERVDSLGWGPCGDRHVEVYRGLLDANTNSGAWRRRLVAWLSGAATHF